MEPDNSYVSLSGELDTASVGPALEVIKGAIAASTRQILTINLADVTFADSSALGMLLDVKRRAEAAGHELLLTNVPQQLVRVLEITKLDDVFDIEQTLDEQISEAPPQSA